jgi:DNA-binding MarR family transcriptional regulator
MDEQQVKVFRDKLREIQRKLGWSQKNDIQCCGITVAQCHALIEIGERGRVSIVELAGTLHVDTSTLSRTIDNMCKAGLVDRALNPQDRRYVTLSLTDRGGVVFRSVEDSFNNYALMMLGFIDEEKHPLVMEGLELIAAALDRCNREFPCCASLAVE